MALWLWGVALATGSACQLVWASRSKARVPAGQSLLGSAIERIGAQPFVRELCQWEAVAPAVDWLSQLAWNHEDALGPLKARGALVLAGPMAGMAVAFLGSSGPLFAVGLAGGYGGVLLAASSLRRQQARQVAKAIPDAYRSLAGSLGAGQTLSQAIGYVGRHSRGKVGEAFKQGSFELACGASVEEALDVVCGSIDDPSVGLLSCALLVSQRTGAPLAPLLERSAELVEDKEGLETLLHTKTAQVRFSAAVVMVLPLLLVGLLLLISPDFRAGVASPIGLGSLFVAALLDLAAIAIMRSLLKGVLS